MLNDCGGFQDTSEVWNGTDVPTDNFHYCIAERTLAASFETSTPSVDSGTLAFPSHLPWRSDARISVSYDGQTEIKGGARLNPSPIPAVTQQSEHLSEEQERLVIEHLPIVRRIARQIHMGLPQHVPIEDLFSAGVVGLIDAATKFDPSKGILFGSYAQFRIRGAMLDSLRALDWSPRDLRRKGRAIEQAIQTLGARFEREPEEAEIAQELGIGLSEYQQLLGELKGLEVGSLQRVRGEESDEDDLAYVPSRPEDDPLYRCLRGEMRQRLMDAVDALPERERQVMTLYYYEEMTMKEIGYVVGVKESRISQIHASAVLHLRTMLSNCLTLDRRSASPHHLTSLPARLDPRKRGRSPSSCGSQMQTNDAWIIGATAATGDKFGFPALKP